MVNRNFFKKTTLLGAAALAMTATVLTGCEKIYDYQGDCTVNYHLRFVYDMNLKWADAFPSEVHSVHLYAFDAGGILVRDYVVNDDAIDIPGYEMELGLDPGRYTLVAWCGMDNAGATGRDFTVAAPVAGQTRLSDIGCTLNVADDSEALTPEVAEAHGNGTSYSDARLAFLYHGILDVDLPEADGGDFYYTMYLTKDTNHIRIILRQLSTEDMDPEDFQFHIDDANGAMAYNNAMASTDDVCYLPWAVGADMAGVTPDDDSSIVYTKGVTADFSTSRLMADHDEDMFLTITSENKTVAHVPLIQYALLSKEYYVMAYGHNMDDQEFLDREDEYVFTFFLDDSKRWTEVQIQIMSWRMTIQNYDI